MPSKLYNIIDSKVAKTFINKHIINDNNNQIAPHPIKLNCWAHIINEYKASFKIKYLFQWQETIKLFMIPPITIFNPVLQYSSKYPRCPNCSDSVKLSSSVYFTLH